MTKRFNQSVVLQIYIGSGEKAEKLRKRIIKKAARLSISKFFITSLMKTNPELFNER